MKRNLEMSTNRPKKAKNKNMNRQHQDVHPNILTFSKKEILARNRNKTGYNVYELWFYHDWKLCNDEEQRGALIQYNVHSEEEYDDEDFVISDPAITAVDVLFAVCKVLGRTDRTYKEDMVESCHTCKSITCFGSFYCSSSNCR
jgi:hypothetical protein